MFTRERHRRGVLYFGPYANAKKVRETLDVLNRVFRYRPCEGPKPGRHSGIPCLDYHIDRCLAPCVGYVSKEDYREVIDGVIEFLSGDTTADPARARAADAGGGGRRSASRTRRATATGCSRSSTSPSGRRADRASVGTIDVIGLAVERRPRRRAGLPAARRADGRPLLASTSRTSPARTGRRCSRRSASSTTAPRRACRRRSSSRATPATLAALAEFLSELRGSRVEVRAPRARREAAAAGARGRRTRARARRRTRARRDEAAAPRRGARGAARGAEPRGAAAPDRVLRHLEHPGPGHRRLDGRVRGRLPKKAHYRKFAVREQAGQDDFAAMAEVVSRRFARALRTATDAEYDERSPPRRTWS